MNKKIKNFFTSTSNQFFFFMLLIVVILRILFITPVKVEGNSMQPTLNSGNRAFALKSSSNLSKGDIIIFEYEQKTYVKRIIGTPGDKLVFTNKEIKINDQLIKEEYLITYPENTDFLNNKESIELEVPKKNFFVLGDNRLNSIDSREFGVISEDRIIGKIFFAYDFKVFLLLQTLSFRGIV